MELELSPLLQGREKSTIFVKFSYVAQISHSMQDVLVEDPQSPAEDNKVTHVREASLHTTICPPLSLSLSSN